ncbi:ubiquinone biosynthesis monooxygenase Coq7 [Rhodoferax ferrireducens]|uniref:Ubiquinone biosynthesis monooxygenase Coq7 n=1 Tax=Rhodoferax ferrireducens TaxID=192843 RepID=A0ABU2C411_9BURK|nr:demethoxyubiquinone hydroxylase family protein [Rhodoferax ferrireducens]MDR7376064.1 ubiquinone biosynthesis monooxygenase Coq7 [Rhodoferax ferrireducens]
MANLRSDISLGSRMLRVNHAGEHGAVNIYAGQILAARLTASSLVPELAEFKAHEEKHRALFWAELQLRGVRRCRSYWLCGTGGFLLGLLTGVLGRHFIASTTVAVERVVLKHLRAQLQELSGHDDRAVSVISAIVEEEQHHHDQSASHLSKVQVMPALVGHVVSASTESVIWLGMRI